MASSTAAKLEDFTKFLSNACIITVQVGKDGKQEIFSVQQSLLESASEYFVKALSERFKESQEGVLRFPEDDVGTWKLFLYWLFNRKLLHNDKDDTNERQRQDVRCWIFGDKYTLPAFQNAAMAALFVVIKTDATTPMDLIKYTFDNTHPGSKLRLVMVDQLAEEFFGDDEASPAMLCSFEGIPGFLTEFLAAYQHWIGKHNVTDISQSRLLEWEKKRDIKMFMVADRAIANKKSKDTPRPAKRGRTSY